MDIHWLWRKHSPKERGNLKKVLARKLTAVWDTCMHLLLVRMILFLFIVAYYIFIIIIIRFVQGNICWTK